MGDLRPAETEPVDPGGRPPVLLLAPTDARTAMPPSQQEQIGTVPEADTPVPHTPDYTYAVEALTARFGGAVGAEQILAAVAQARDEIEPRATVHDFLHLLVERRARAILTARSRNASE